MIGVLGMNFFDIHKMPNKGIPLAVQRKLWLRNFMQAFFCRILCLHGDVFNSKQF